MTQRVTITQDIIIPTTVRSAARMRAIVLPTAEDRPDGLILYGMGRERSPDFAPHSSTHFLFWLVSCAPVPHREIHDRN